MPVQELANLCEYEAHMIGLGIQPQSKAGLEEDFVAPAEILQVDGSDRAVGDRDQRSVVSADPRRTQANIFHDACAISEAAHISHSKDFVAQY